MKNITTISILTILTLLAGCASHKTAPKVAVNRQETYNVEFDKAWDMAVDFFAENGINLNKIEKDSGLLTAYNGAVGVGRYLNCGEAQGLGSGFENVNSRLNVLVRKADQDTSKIAVNLNASAQVVRRNLYGHALETMSVPCETTGLLESEMHSHFRARIADQQPGG